MSGPNAIYEDGRYTVTSEIIATPSRFYPIRNTTARIRRDPFWAALAWTGLTAGAITVYGDLLRLSETAAMVSVCAAALLIGHRIAILRVDSAGHPAAVIVASTSKVITLYRAIIFARNQQLTSHWEVFHKEVNSERRIGLLS